VVILAYYIYELGNSLRTNKETTGQNHSNTRIRGADMDYPVPDPAWDYAGIWHSTQQAKQKIEELLAYMAQIEDATPESDAIVRTHKRTHSNRCRGRERVPQ
jgi:hypothetical protein